MAIHRSFVGGAPAIAQVNTVQITAYDVNTSYILSVGGISVSVKGNTDINTTASDLMNAWNNSTYPYFTVITASVVTNTITLTADNVGVPFFVTSSVSGGTGTMDAVVTFASATVQIMGYDAATTYKLTAGGVTVSAVGNTDVDTTASDLADAWNASVSVYFTIATAIAVTDTITITQDSLTVPFTAVESVTGGTGTIGAVVPTISGTGPNHFDQPLNWLGGVVPLADDDWDVSNTNWDILWGITPLQTGGLFYGIVDITDTFTGRIGLDDRVFAINASSSSASAPEYRSHYMKFAAVELNIGKSSRPSRATGSGRIKIHNTTTSTGVINVYGSATSIDTDYPAVRLLINTGSTVDLNVYKVGRPTVGVGIDDPTKPSALRDVYVSEGNSHSLTIGNGVAILGSYTQDGGNVLLSLGEVANVPVMTFNGGNATIEGDFIISVLTVNDTAKVIDNHIDAADVSVAVANLNGGELDTTHSNAARTYTIVNQEVGNTFKYNSNSLTITNMYAPSGRVALTAVRI